VAKLEQIPNGRDQLEQNPVRLKPIRIFCSSGEFAGLERFEVEGLTDVVIGGGDGAQVALSLGTVYSIELRSGL
jgi:hypothetical protein